MWREVNKAVEEFRIWRAERRLIRAAVEYEKNRSPLSEGDFEVVGRELLEALKRYNECGRNYLWLMPVVAKKLEKYGRRI